MLRKSRQLTRLECRYRFADGYLGSGRCSLPVAWISDSSDVFLSKMSFDNLFILRYFLWRPLRQQVAMIQDDYSVGE